MSKDWDKMDQKVWANSEVMQELEKRMISLSDKFGRIVEAQQLTQKLTETKKHIDDAGVSMKNLLNSAGVQSLADDNKESAQNMAVDSIEKECDCGECEACKAKHQEGKDSLLSELISMAESAADLGDIKLAYKIERTIAEILEEE